MENCKSIDRPIPAKNSNKITAIRLANLSEQHDPDLDKLINYDRLQLHNSFVSNDIESKKRYFKDFFVGGRMKIIHISEERFKVIIHFQVILQEVTTNYFNVYKFSKNGMLTDMWMNQMPV